MPNQLIFDNWTLQDVKDLYLSGLSDDSTSEIIIDEDNDSHSFQDIPKGFRQIEVLFSFLQKIFLPLITCAKSPISYWIVSSIAK